MQINELFDTYASHLSEGVGIFEWVDEKQNDLKFHWCNNACLKLFDSDAEILLGSPLSRYSGNETNLEDLYNFYEHSKDLNKAEVDVLLYRATGTKFWARISIAKVVDTAGESARWFGILQDVTRQRLKEEAASRAIETRTYLTQKLKSVTKESQYNEQRVWNSLEALPVAFVIYDKDDRLVICNEEYRRTYSEIADVIKPGKTFEQILRTALRRKLYPEAFGREEQWLETRLFLHRNPTEAIEQRLTGNRYLKIQESITENGDIVGFRMDITELKRSQKRLELFASALENAKGRIQQQALHDPLTDLANRRHLDEYLQECVERCAKNNEKMTLLHVDLDRFKHINDTLGHAAGDEVLVHVADVLRKVTRETDIVARIGGDEFVVVCVSEADQFFAEKIAERIVKELSEPVLYNGQTCRFGASVGIAAAGPENIDPAKLLMDADVALYQAKRNGRGQVVPFSGDLQADIIKAKKLSDEIMQALDNSEFIPYFQPQFCAKTHNCVGVECLVRWQHPERGILPPFEFLGAAEEIDVVGQIDRMLYEKAIRTCLDLREEGINLPKLSVNVSFRRLADPNLIETMQEIYHNELTVAFELLETIFLDEQTDMVNWNIDKLRDLGLEIEIDDFGSGRASIIGLTKVRPNRLKIDRQLISPINTSGLQMSIVEAIIRMGRALSISVTAEGVETMEHAHILRELGCDTLQGFAFAKPMSATELKHFLKNETWRNAA